MKVVMVMTSIEKEHEVAEGLRRVYSPSGRFYWDVDDITIICKRCGSPVNPPRRKFCSNRCASAYHSLAYYHRNKRMRDAERLASRILVRPPLSKE